MVSDWPCSTEAWDPIVLFSVVTRFKAHAKACLSHPAPVRQPSATFLTADTHQESSRVPSHVTLSRDSLPSANTTLDLSFSRIKTKQYSDPDILPIINRLRTVLSDPQFALQEDAFFCFLPPYNAATSSRVPFLPKSLVPLVLRTCHDHPPSE